MLIETVNLHVTGQCNLSCAYCFGPFPRAQAISEAGWCRIIDQLPAAGVRRVTFSGGEPTLFRPLPALLRHAKGVGLQTSIVTNGACLTDDMLAHIDLVGTTLDSARPEVNERLGRRAPRGIPYHEHVQSLASRARTAGALVKINTVVCSLNAEEDLVDLITAIAPSKWKALQFASVNGGNDTNAPWLSISGAQFDAFVERQARIRGRGIWFAPEAEDVVKSSYVMLDPAGRVFRNPPQGYLASRPVLEVGFERAVAEVGGYDRGAFLARGGDCDIASLRMGGAR